MAFDAKRRNIDEACTRAQARAALAYDAIMNPTEREKAAGMAIDDLRRLLVEVRSDRDALLVNIAALVEENSKLRSEVDTLSAERNRLLQQTAVAVERAEAAEDALLEAQEHHDLMGDDNA